MKIEYIKDSKVIAISPIRTRTLFPSIGKVETYWEALRDGRAMPSRDEVDPRGIADVLEYAFVLEKIGPGLARIRLAGMHLNDLMDMEVRGMPITAMFTPEARREMQSALESVMESPAVVRLTLDAESGMARPPLEAQMILMPLRDDAGRPTRIIGALQARGEIGRGPRRFAIRDIETKPVEAENTLPDDYTRFSATQSDAQIAGFAEAKKPFAPRTMEVLDDMRSDTKKAGAIASKRPRLVLVHDAENA